MEQIFLIYPIFPVLILLLTAYCMWVVLSSVPKWMSKSEPKPTETTLGMMTISTEILDEASRAARKWPPFNSAHEGYAVMLEEVDELWDHVKVNQKKRDIEAMRTEAIQVAAMALRFVADVCDGGRGRK